MWWLFARLLPANGVCSGCFAVGRLPSGLASDQYYYKKTRRRTSLAVSPLLHPQTSLIILSYRFPVSLFCFHRSPTSSTAPCVHFNCTSEKCPLPQDVRTGAGLGHARA